MDLRHLLGGMLLLVLLAGCGGGDEAGSPDAGLVMEERGEYAEAVAQDGRSSSPPQPAATLAQEVPADDGQEESQPTSAPQSRVVVHTAQISLVVGEVAGSVDRIGQLAAELGGWVVSSERSSTSTGSIAIRVPAERLDAALGRLEALALEVVYRTVTSEDVTDTFVDSQSRLVGLRATEARLLALLDRADDVEDALQIQEALSGIQLRIEQTEGRLHLLSQTAAYSLIEVTLKLTPTVIEVDAGPDSSVRVDQVVRFRASFTAPPGVDDYSFVWDFGDGSSLEGRGSVLTSSGQRVTATVTHVYGDDRDSPYIATIDLTGSGDGGLVEGSDALLVSVSRVPTIEVFAGDDRTVEEGSTEAYRASFTRPEELWDYEYRWDFGDGSPTVSGTLEAGDTRAQAAHRFADHRPVAYEVVLTVTAMSEAGPVSGSDTFFVQVTQAEGLVVGGWDLPGTARSAVRALSAVAQAAAVLLIWLGIFSPLLLALWGVAYLARRFRPRVRLRRRVARPSPDDGNPALDPGS